MKGLEMTVRKTYRQKSGLMDHQAIQGDGVGALVKKDKLHLEPQMACMVLD